MVRPYILLTKMDLHYKSDFTLRLQAVNPQGQDLAALCRECNFHGKVFTSSSTRCVCFGRVGETFTNCRLSPDGDVLVVCDSHALSWGRVMLRIEIEVPNANYPDGYERLSAEVPTDLRLTPTGAASATEASVQAILPYVSPYQIALRGGFQGSEQEFNRALASITSGGYTGVGDGEDESGIIAEMAKTIKKLKQRNGVKPYICRGMISINSHPGNIYALRGLHGGDDAMMFVCRLEEDGENVVISNFKKFFDRIRAITGRSSDDYYLMKDMVIGFHCRSYFSKTKLIQFPNVFKREGEDMVISKAALCAIFEDVECEWANVNFKLFYKLGRKISEAAKDRIKVQYVKISERYGDLCYINPDGQQPHKLNPPTKADIEELVRWWFKKGKICKVQYRKKRTGNHRHEYNPAIAHYGKDWVYANMNAGCRRNFSHLFRARRKRGRYYSDWVYFRVYVTLGETMTPIGLKEVVIISAEGDCCSHRKLKEGQ